MSGPFVKFTKSGELLGFWWTIGFRGKWAIRSEVIFV